MKKITTFIRTILMVMAILFIANSTKAVVTMEYDGITYICDMIIEGNTIYMENCRDGLIGEVEVTGTNGGGSENTGEIGSWTPVSEPSYPTGGGGGGGTTSNTSNQQDELSYSEFGPGKINTSLYSDQKVLEMLVGWFEYLCNNKNVSHSLETIVNTDVIQGSAGMAGAYVNGGGKINGINVIWQFQTTTNGENNDNLGYVTWDEPPKYYRAALNQDGLRSEPRIILLFNSPEDRTSVLGNIPCVWK